MEPKIERLIKAVYRKWKSGQPSVSARHPDEETIACLLEGKLSEQEAQVLKAHLISCQDCATALAVHLSIKAPGQIQPPADLIRKIKEIEKQPDYSGILEIILKLKEKALEILNTTGDVLVGQELVPAPVLRSRKLKDFKDEVNILKDFKDIRVEVKIENKYGKSFNVAVLVKNKETARILKDLRITLFKEDLELESYVSEVGAVTFENVILGKYAIVISNLEDKLATLLLDIKV